MKISIALTTEALEMLAKDQNASLCSWHFQSFYHGGDLSYPNPPKPDAVLVGELELPIPRDEDFTQQALNALQAELQALLALQAQAEQAIRSRISNLLAIEAPKPAEDLS